MTVKAIPANRAAAMAAFASIVGCTAVIAMSPTAEARIACSGNYQIVQGQPIATPYCQDENLAAVARQAGMRVTGRQIRSSEGTKARACRLVGYDNRVSESCASYRLDPSSRRRY